MTHEYHYNAFWYIILLFKMVYSGMFCFVYFSCGLMLCVHIMYSVLLVNVHIYVLL